MEYTYDELIAAAGERFNPLPEGTYVAVVDEAEPTVSKKSGNQMITVELSIAEGPETGKSPKTVYISKPGPGTLPKKLKGATNMFLGHLTALGVSLEALQQHKPTMGQIAAAIVGKRVIVEIEHETYKGRKNATVQGTLQPPEGGAVEITEFPVLSEAEQLGYGSQVTATAAVDDAGF